MAYYIIKKVVPKDVPLRRIFFTRSGQQEATWRRTAGGVEDNEEYNRRSGQQEASWRRTREESRTTRSSTGGEDSFNGD